MHSLIFIRSKIDHVNLRITAFLSSFPQLLFESMCKFLNIYTCPNHNDNSIDSMNSPEIRNIGRVLIGYISNKLPLYAYFNKTTWDAYDWFDFETTLIDWLLTP